MSKRKGVTADEKRKRMLDLFYEKKDFFQLKELEKLGPTEKGVISQSVKEVVQSLVDDGMVCSEKIGTSVYFWSFPSEAVNLRKRKVNQLESTLESLTSQKDEITQKVKRAKLERTDCEERDELNKKVTELELERDRLKKAIAQYQDSDPDVIKKELQETDTAIEATNRWTDNIFGMCNWLKNKFSMEQEALNKQFGIPAELDYIER